MTSTHGADQVEFIDGPRPRQPTRRLSPRLYLVVVAATGALALAQFYFLPGNLDAVQFGYTVVGLSVIQAGLQLSDLGMVNASLRSDLAADVRDSLRRNAVSIAALICVCGAAGCALAAAIGHTSALVFAAALLCALWLIADRARASAAVQHGDEKAATRHNIVWQNAPKLGSIVGSFGGTAVLALLGALATSVVASRPRRIRRPDWASVGRSAHLWVPGLCVALSAFLLTWTETYLLSLFVGVGEAGQYQAVVRPLTGITYLYLPIVALIQAAHNAGAHRRVTRLNGTALGISTAGAAAIAVFLGLAGNAIWPDFEFATPVVAAAAIAAVAMCASTLAGMQLLLRGHQGVAAGNAVLGAVVLVVVSALTLRTMGPAGAALASACAWSFVTLCHLVVLFVVRHRHRRSSA